MLDQILAWVVIFFPTALSIAFIFIPARTENERLHMRWRYSLVALGILFSAITGWQQVRAVKASAADREKAIQETSEKVSTETSTRVTKAVGEQYKGMVGDLYLQIGTLQSQLAAQGKDVSVIKGSNIVTGAAPLKVEVTNPGVPPLGGPPQKFTATMNWINSPEPQYGKYSKALILVGTVNVLHPRMYVNCDRDFNRVNANLWDAGVQNGG